MILPLAKLVLVLLVLVVLVAVDYRLAHAPSFLDCRFLLRIFVSTVLLTS